jgi:hypothetical protein
VTSSTSPADANIPLRDRERLGPTSFGVRKPSSSRAEETLVDRPRVSGSAVSDDPRDAGPSAEWNFALVAALAAAAAAALPLLRARDAGVPVLLERLLGEELCGVPAGDWEKSENCETSDTTDRCPYEPTDDRRSRIDTLLTGLRGPLRSEPIELKLAKRRFSPGDCRCGSTKDSPRPGRYGWRGDSSSSLLSSRSARKNPRCVARVCVSGSAGSSRSSADTCL